MGSPQISGVACGRGTYLPEAAPSIAVPATPIIQYFSIVVLSRGLSAEPT